jgi:hypothetical protein
MKPDPGFRVHRFSDEQRLFASAFLELGEQTFAARDRLLGRRATRHERPLDFSGELPAGWHPVAYCFGPQMADRFVFERSFYVFSFGFSRLFGDMPGRQFTLYFPSFVEMVFLFGADARYFRRNG